MNNKGLMFLIRWKQIICRDIWIFESLLVTCWCMLVFVQHALHIGTHGRVLVSLDINTHFSVPAPPPTYFFYPWCRFSCPTTFPQTAFMSALPRIISMTVPKMEILFSFSLWDFSVLRNKQKSDRWYQCFILNSFHASIFWKLTKIKDIIHNFFV